MTSDWKKWLRKQKFLVILQTEAAELAWNHQQTKMDELQDKLDELQIDYDNITVDLLGYMKANTYLLAGNIRLAAESPRERMLSKYDTEIWSEPN